MGNKQSRTYKTALNAASSISNNVLKVLVKFASRYVFVFTLGQQYLGVNALFSSIITMLSLADLGFGIALPQALYKPLADKDEKQICKILRFYSKVYLVVALAVITIGIAILPFLKLIIADKDTTSIEHINIIYILFILHSAASYLFIYKRTLFTADQKNYYVTVVESFVNIITAFVQILVLLITKEYILYLIISIISVVLQNIYISYKCDRYYPFLKNIKKAEKLNRHETKVLTKKIYALFIYKIAIAVETGTDNLVMTSICGLIATGICSNYTLVTTSLRNIVMMAMSAATASIGNVVVTEKPDDAYRIYNLLDFLGFWIYSVCGVCLIVLIDPFIEMMFGSEYLLGLGTVIVLCINFYVCGTQNVNSNFRNAYGLFYEGRYRPILMILVNLGSSIILAKYIGITGIFIGTLLSRLLTVGTFDPYIVFKYGLHAPLKQYYQSHGFYHVVTIVTGAVMFIVFRNWITDSVFMWILKAICVFVLTNILYIIIFFRNDNFKDAKNRVISILRKVIHAR